MSKVRNLMTIRIMRTWLFAALFVSTFGLLQTFARADVTITILHDNDLHGHLLSYAYTELGQSSLEQPVRGGAARRATLIRRLRSSIKNPTLLIDSGDIATRGPLATTYKGLADVVAMNAIGYNLAAVGNNEFKLKDGVDATDSAGAQAALLEVVRRSNFPWICANATDGSGAFLSGVQPYIVRTIAGVRIGFLGLTAARSAAYPQTKGWIISDPIIAADHWIPIIRQHCDVLIAVTHIGVTDDVKLAEQTSGIDAIIGGDSHTFLYTPLVEKNSVGSQVPIVQDGEFGADLGRFDLKFRRDSAGAWHLSSYKDVLIPIDSTIPEAKDVDAVLAPYVKPFVPVVGLLEQIANTPTGRTTQTTQIFLSAMRKETNSDYAVNPNGAGFFEVFRHHEVTRYDVFATMPFHDDVVIATLSGANLSALIAKFPNTVVSGNATNIVTAATYRVALMDYEADSAYKIPPSEITATGLDLRSVVISYFSQTGQQIN